MICKRFVTACAIAVVATTGVANAGLQLIINGDKVTGPSGLVKFEYSPGSQILELQSFFKDLRCMPASTLPASAIEFKLDSLSEIESEAVYRIPTTGSIEYDPVAGTVSVQTTGIDQTASIDCAHEFEAVGDINIVTGEASKGAVSVQNFEDLFSVVISDSENGFGFDITITNKSALFVGRNVTVPLTLDTSLLPDPSPKFESVQPDNAVVNLDVWTIPILWPGEHAVLSVTYDSLSPGDEIFLGIGGEEPADNIQSLNRSADQSVVTVVNTSSSKILMN